MKIEIKKNKLPVADCRLPVVFAGSATRRSASIVNRKSKIVNAFTLVEMLLVVTIIGILAALVIPKIVGRSEQARTTAAHADLSAIKTALDAFEIDNGFFPKNLGDLLVAPGNAKSWKGPYLDKIPSDPWGNNYNYYFPGKHNANSYDLVSVGPDAKEGTDDDVGNWTK